MLVTFESKLLQGLGKGADDEKRREERVEKAENKRTSSLSPLKVRMMRVVLNSGDLAHFNLSRRSRNGCLTCKIRKKKCDELRPTCGDCQRLNKECVWADYDNMDEEELKSLKESVLRCESILKLRRRKSKAREEGNNGVLTLTSETAASRNGIQFIAEESPEYSSAVKRRKNSQRKPPLLAISDKISSNAAETSLLRIRDRPNKANQTLLSPMFDIFRELGEKYEESCQRYLNESSEARENDDEIVSFNSNTRPALGNASPLYDYLAGSNLMSYGSELNIFKEFMRDNVSFSADSMRFSLVDSTADILPKPSCSLSSYPGFSEKSEYLFRFFFEVLSSKVSIIPISHDNSNSYSNMLIPMTQKDDGVLHAILAWSSFYLGGDWNAEGHRHLKLTLQHMNLDEEKEQEIDFGGTRLERTFKLTALLILCAAEICSGDVKNWTKYLRWGGRLLKDAGGISNFNLSGVENWLLCNFAYHDLLSSPAGERGPFFPPEDYKTVFSNCQLHPLLGILRDIYRLIGNINILSLETKRLSEEDSETSFGEILEGARIISHSLADSHYNEPETSSSLDVSADESERLSAIFRKASALEKQIEDLQPRAEEISHLSHEELELQLTLFEAFQLSAKLLLRQDVFKCCPCSLMSRILTVDLNKCIDILLDSPVQASLAFPVFIAGIHCTGKAERDCMLKRVDKFIKLYGEWNVGRIKQVMQIVWEEYPLGRSVVDWHKILKDLDWDLNFA